MRVGSGGKERKRPVELNGIKLSWHKKVKHLGNIVTNDLEDDENINYMRGIFISQVNKLKCKLSTIHSTLLVDFSKRIAAPGMVVRHSISQADPCSE